MSSPNFVRPGSRPTGMRQRPGVTFSPTPSRNFREAPLANLAPSNRQLTTLPRYVASPVTPSPVGVQVPRSTPSPQTYVKFYDGQGAASTTSKKQKKPRRPRKKAGWEKLLCVEEMQALARRGPKMPNFSAACGGRGASVNNRGYHPRNQYEFRDGPRLVSIDSTEDNWDLPPDYPDNLMPARMGPKSGRYADDFGITAKDLFPWLASLLDSCCCSEKKRPRALIRPRGEMQARGPQLETVCLDCGNVLEHHSMPHGHTNNVLGDNYHWPGASALSPYEDLKEGAKYEGYSNWTVTQNDTETRKGKKVQLPAFQAGPTRVFKNVPNMTTSQRGLESDFNNLDEAGRVVLPNFPETAPAETRA